MNIDDKSIKDVCDLCYCKKGTGMSENKSLFYFLDLWWQQRTALNTSISKSNLPQPTISHKWFPTYGNAIFTLLVLGSLLWAQSVGAISVGAPLTTSDSAGTIAYQGRLADNSGSPLTQTVNMTFRLYAAASGGVPLWEEGWTGANSVQVSDGLFNVMLGSLNPIGQAVITGNNNLFLGITVGTDSEMSPRVQLGSVPFATQALTVPDGSITTAKLADGAVTSAKLNQSLQSGSACLNLPTQVTLQSNYGRVPVSGLKLTLTMDRESTVLIWSTGENTYTPLDGGHSGSSIYLGETEVTNVSRIPSNEGWVDFAMIKQVQIPAGTHTLDFRSFALSNGTATYSVDTCLQYLVFG
jgi:hypothetical protein